MNRPILRSLVESFYTGRSVVLFGRPLAEYAEAIRCLGAYSADKPFVVCNGTEYPNPAQSALGGVYPIDFGYVQEGLVRRTAMDVLRKPPSDLVAALNAYDPSGRAVVLAESISSEFSIAGRAVIDALYAGSIKLHQIAQPRLNLVPRMEAELADLGRTVTALDLGYGVLAWDVDASESTFGVDCHWIPSLDDSSRGWKPHSISCGCRRV